MISVRLVPGPYRVSLGGAWYLERMTASGAQRIEKSALLSEPIQCAYIGNKWYTDLEFRFGVDGTLIDFRHGNLNIDIRFELPGEGPGYPDVGFHEIGEAVDHDQERGSTAVVERARRGRRRHRAEPAALFRRDVGVMQHHCRRPGRPWGARAVWCEMTPMRSDESQAATSSSCSPAGQGSMRSESCGPQQSSPNSYGSPQLR
ncbi:MAG TPA: hypothetical protein VI299_16840 [Polyangiales bacterium]